MYKKIEDPKNALVYSNGIVLLKLFNVNLKLDEFVLIIQIVLKNYIKDLLAKKYLKNSSILKVYMSLFFEINKRINNFKLYNLDVYQTLNTIKYIFIKHSDDLKKI